MGSKNLISLFKQRDALKILIEEGRVEMQPYLTKVNEDIRSEANQGEDDIEMARRLV